MHVSMLSPKGGGEAGHMWGIGHVVVLPPWGFCFLNVAPRLGVLNQKIFFKFYGIYG